MDAFDDVLVGEGDLDLMVGDVFGTGGVRLTASVGRGGGGGYDSRGGGGGSENTMSAFDDTLDGGAGADTLTGDVYSIGDNVTTALHVSAGRVENENGGYSGGGGSGNTLSAFNDTLDGGAGTDALTGDVYNVGNDSTAELSVSAGSGGSTTSYTPGGGGDQNDVFAFSDMLEGGSGRDLLVGDVWSGGSGEVVLNLATGADGSSPWGYDWSNGGVGNQAAAFNDDLDGGDGDDLLVGDVYFTGSGATVTVNVEGTEGNTVAAFRDTLTGGDGADTLYGDFFDGTGAFEPVLDVDGDFDGRDGLFADSLDGGNGDDLIVGGLGSDTLTGGAGADTFGFSAADTVFGGGGDDTITDFQVSGADVIALTGYGVTDVSELTCTQVGVGGADAEISGFGGGTITLLDFDCTELDNADFVFG
jgi:hypothetical protein